MMEYDIVIAGAGMVGLALAASLRDSDCRVALVEARTLPGAWQASGESVDDYDPRVSALTLASQRLLQDVGAWQGIQSARARAYGHMHVWDALGTASIDFDAQDVSRPALGHIVENAVTCSALMAQLEGASNISFHAEDPIESFDYSECGPQQLQLQSGASLSATLLVAADGANSFLREQAGFDLREWSYQQKAIVATVQCSAAHEATAWQRFLPQGPLAFLPLAGADDRLCSIVWSCDDARADEIMAMDDAGFKQVLGRSIERRLGDVCAVSRRFMFPLRQRHARGYTKPGMVLLGDAAHVIHPLAGQGVNLGFQDVVALADELKRAQQRGLSFAADEVLGRYQRRRMGDNLGMMAVMEGFKRLYGETAPAAVVLRNFGMRNVDRLGLLKQQIIRRAMGF